MEATALVIDVYLALILVSAAVGKLLYYEEFKAGLFRHNIVPKGLVGFLAAALILLEYGLGVLLLGAIWYAKLAAILLLLAFAAYNLSLFVRTRVVTCGCFGAIADANLTKVILTSNVIWVTMAFTSALVSEDAAPSLGGFFVGLLVSTACLVRVRALIKARRITNFGFPQGRVIGTVE